MSWLWNWFADWFDWYKWFKGKNCRLLIIGLDNAGKTTLMKMLKDGVMITAQPTRLPNSEVLSFDGIQFTTFDLGGHPQARRVWRDYFPAVDAIVFVIDVTDYDKLPVARSELEQVLTDELVANAPVLILGNKIDKVGALSEEELKVRLGLYNQTTGKTIPKGRKTKDPNRNDPRPLEIFMCSVMKRTGYGDGIRWLAEQV